MLENLYTTKMSNDKEKLKNRLENIQRQPKKKHKLVGLLVFLALAAALTVGTLCLAATDQEAAPNVTMTDQEFTAFLEEPLAPTMPNLDYADQKILVFHYKGALFVVDLTNHFSFRYIFDLRDLNLTQSNNTAVGNAYLQVDVTQDGSQVYLSTGGPKDLVSTYDTYVIDLTTGQVKAEKLPQGTQFFLGQQESLEIFPDLVGDLPMVSAYCVPVEDRTYYLGAGSGYIRDLQLVTRYADGRPDKVWYLFGEPPYYPDEPITEDSDSSATAEPTAPTDGSEAVGNGNRGSTDTAPSEPSLQQTGHFNTLGFKTGNYLTSEFSRAYSSNFEILEQSLSDWDHASENEGTFLYTVTYTAQDAEDQQEPLQMTIPMKVTRGEDGQLTLYRDTSEFGGQDSTGPEWAPADVQSLLTLP